MKKIFALLLSAMLTFGCTFLPATAVEEENTRVYFNGEPLEISVTRGRPEYVYETFLRYVPLMERAGLETSFDRETGTVTSKGNGLEVSFVPGEPRYRVVRGGVEQIITEGVLAPVIFDDVTYLDLRTIQEVFGYVIEKDGYAERVIDIMDPYALLDDFKAKAPLVGTFFDRLNLPEQFSASVSSNQSVSGSSQTFGYSLSVGGDFQATLQRDGETLYARLDMDGSGLYNFVKLFSLADTAKEYGLAFEAAQMDEPITIECCLTPEHIYLKSDSLAANQRWGSRSGLYVPWDKQAEANQFMQGQWIEIPASQPVYGFSTDIFDLFTNPLPDGDAILLASIRNCLDSGSGYRFTDEESVPASLYPTRKIQVEFMESLLTPPYFTLEQTEDGLSGRYQMDASQLRSLLLTPDILDEADASFAGKLFDVLSGKLDVSILFEADGALSVRANADAQLQNIPNDYGVQFGSFSGTATAELTLTPDSGTVALPEDFLTYDEIVAHFQTYAPEPEPSISPS